MAESRVPGGLARLALVLLAAIVLAAYFLVFTVQETQQKLVIRLGKISRVVEEPGLHFKLPWETAVELEARLLSVVITTTEADDVLTLDQRRVVVDAFAQWRIDNAARFYESFGGEPVATDRLRVVLFNALREVMGDNNFENLLNENRVTIMNEILAKAREEIGDGGVNIEDVRIRRADLPQQNLEATFARMRSDREEEAEKLRAEGRAEKAATIAQAESDSETIKANGRIAALTRRGEADVLAYRLVREAIGSDAEFHALYRSLRAYETALNDGRSQFVLSPDSDFFQYFRSQGDETAAPQPAEGFVPRTLELPEDPLAVIEADLARISQRYQGANPLPLPNPEEAETPPISPQPAPEIEEAPAPEPMVDPEPEAAAPAGEEEAAAQPEPVEDETPAAE